MYEQLRKINILYVEDDDFIREQTSSLLKTIFNNVYTANNGQEGIEKYKSYTNDLDAIITDINMPKISGIDMAKQINASDSNNKTPIIAVSAYSCEDYGMEEIKDNFSHYLRKPIQIKELINSIEKAIKNEEGEYCKEDK